MKEVNIGKLEALTWLSLAKQHISIYAELTHIRTDPEGTNSVIRGHIYQLHCISMTDYWLANSSDWQSSSCDQSNLEPY